MSKPVRFLFNGKAFWVDTAPPSEVAIRRIVEYDSGKQQRTEGLWLSHRQNKVMLTTHAGVTDYADGDVDSVARQVWPEHFSSETDGNR